MPVYRILHVSDLHFAQDPLRANALHDGDYLRLIREQRASRYRPSTFCPRKSLVLSRFVSDARDEIDLLLVTGDLATHGSPEEMDRAYQWMFGNAGAEFMDRVALQRGVPVPKLGDVREIAVLPGNHDRYFDDENKPRSYEFENRFGKAWDCSRPNSTILGDRVCMYNLVRDGERLVVLRADFSLLHAGDALGPKGYLAQGRVYEDVLRTLVLATKRLRAQSEVPICIVWAAHFPPKFPKGKLSEKLLDDHKLLSVANSVSVPLIFAGHTHLGRSYKPQSCRKARILCAGTASGFSGRGDKKEEHCFFAVDLAVNRGKITDSALRRYDWNEVAADFQSGGSAVLPLN